MKLLITGASGFPGAGLIEALESRHELRLLEVVGRETLHALVVGDVSDLEVCRPTVDGMDALVIA
jgi:nucleoside-diphosphate-sugar epimerase